MIVLRIALGLIFALLLAGCSSTDKHKEHKQTLYGSTPNKLFFKAYGGEFDRGIYTVQAAFQGNMQSFHVYDVEESKTDREFSGTGLIAYPLNLVMTAVAAPVTVLSCATFSEKCGELISGTAELIVPVTCDPKGVASSIECQTDVTARYQHKEEGERVKRSLHHRHGEIYVAFTADNGKSITVPVYQNESLKITLRELDYPKSFTMTPVYLGALSKIESAGESYTIPVPPVYQQINNDLRNNALVTNMITSQNLLEQGVKIEQHKAKSLNQALNNYVTRAMQAYERVLVAPKYPNPLNIAEVSKPAVPEFNDIVKDQFETTAEFNQRYAKAKSQQAETISTLEAQYAKEVAARNQLVELDNLYITELSNQLDANFESRQTSIVDSAKQEAKTQYAYAYAATLGFVDILDMKYNADKQLLSVELLPSPLISPVTLESNMPAKDAKRFVLEWQNILFNDATRPVDVETKYVLKGNNSMELEDARFNLFHVHGALLGDTPIFSYASRTSNYDFDNKPVVKALPKVNPNWNGINAEQYKISRRPGLHKLQSELLLNDSEVEILTSKVTDFDDDIPTLLSKFSPRTKDRRKWLFVVGIENYNFTDSILYAQRSTELFTQVAQKTLGVPNSNTIVLLNEKATAGAIEDNLRILLSKVGSEDSIYFYYNGHGIPNVEQENEPYILPQDKNPSFMNSSPQFKLSSIYQKLSNSSAHNVFVFIDGCFSDTQRDGIVAASVLVPKTVRVDSSKMAVISAAQKDQFAYPYLQKGNRLFSYYLMKELLDSEQNIYSLYNKVRTQVREESRFQQGYSLQEPGFQGNRSLTL
ncbi:caspase family protein [Vibrio chaetopteri]|uniref:caspase family protein n=1 Tax=Vibrio chaetopteri TaxID=3016528 RepID=UPI003AB7B7AE